jgi:hypothetical protein
MRLLLTHGFFLARRPEGAADPAAVSATRDPLLSAYLSSRGFEWMSTIPRGARVKNCSVFSIRASGHARSVRESADASERAGDHRTGSRQRMEVIVRRAGAANYAEEYLAAGADYVVPARANWSWNGC